MIAVSKVVSINLDEVSESIDDLVKDFQDNQLYILWSKSLSIKLYYGSRKITNVIYCNKEQLPDPENEDFSSGYVYVVNNDSVKYSYSRDEIKGYLTLFDLSLDSVRVENNQFIFASDQYQDKEFPVPLLGPSNEIISGVVDTQIKERMNRSYDYRTFWKIWDQSFTVGKGTITIRQGEEVKGSFNVNQEGPTTVELSRSWESW